MTHPIWPASTNYAMSGVGYFPEAGLTPETLTSAVARAPFVRAPVQTLTPQSLPVNVPGDLLGVVSVYPEKRWAKGEDGETETQTVAMAAGAVVLAGAVGALAGASAGKVNRGRNVAVGAVAGLLAGLIGTASGYAATSAHIVRKTAA